MPPCSSGPVIHWRGAKRSETPGPSATAPGRRPPRRGLVRRGPARRRRGGPRRLAVCDPERRRYPRPAGPARQCAARAGLPAAGGDEAEPFAGRRADLRPAGRGGRRRRVHRRQRADRHRRPDHRLAQGRRQGGVPALRRRRHLIGRHRLQRQALHREVRRHRGHRRPGGRRRRRGHPRRVRPRPVPDVLLPARRGQGRPRPARLGARRLRPGAGADGPPRLPGHRGLHARYDADRADRRGRHHRRPADPPGARRVRAGRAGLRGRLHPVPGLVPVRLGGRAGRVRRRPGPGHRAVDAGHRPGGVLPGGAHPPADRAEPYGPDAPGHRDAGDHRGRQRRRGDGDAAVRAADRGGVRRALGAAPALRRGLGQRSGRRGGRRGGEVRQ